MSNILHKITMSEMEFNPILQRREEKESNIPHICSWNKTTNLSENNTHGHLSQQGALTTHVGTCNDLAQSLFSSQSNVICDKITSTEGVNHARMAGFAKFQHSFTSSRSGSELRSRTITTSITHRGSHCQGLQDIEMSYTADQLRPLRVVLIIRRGIDRNRIAKRMEKNIHC